MRVALAILVGLLLSSMAPAARCPRACRNQLTTELRSCKVACPKRRPGKHCRSACAIEFIDARRECRHGSTSPCGGATTTTTATSGTETSTTATTFPGCAPGQLAGDACGSCGTGGCFPLCSSDSEIPYLACLGRNPLDAPMPCGPSAAVRPATNSARATRDLDCPDGTSCKRVDATLRVNEVPNCDSLATSDPVPLYLCVAPCL